MSFYGDDSNGYDYTGWERQEDDNYGDPRTCEFHPGQRTSSNDGLFDAPCPECEYEMSVEAAQEAFEADQVAETMAPAAATFSDFEIPF